MGTSRHLCSVEYVLAFSDGKITLELGLGTQHLCPHRPLQLPHSPARGRAGISSPHRLCHRQDLPPATPPPVTRHDSHPSAGCQGRFVPWLPQCPTALMSTSQAPERSGGSAGTPGLACQTWHLRHRLYREGREDKAVRADGIWESPTSSNPRDHTPVHPGPFPPSKCSYLPGLC